MLCYLLKCYPLNSKGQCSTAYYICSIVIVQTSYAGTVKYALLFFKKKWAISDLFFFIYVFSKQLAVNVQYKFLAMTGFEPQTSGIGNNHSTN